MIVSFLFSSLICFLVELIIDFFSYAVFYVPIINFFPILCHTFTNFFFQAVSHILSVLVFFLGIF